MDILRSNRSGSKAGSYGNALRADHSHYNAEARVTSGSSGNEISRANGGDADSVDSQESQAMIIRKETSYQVTYAHD